MYRYGFNGQEGDNEINGQGNAYTAEFWEYDPREGRRWNLDPKPTVGISQYVAFDNNPILYPDPLGDSAGPVIPRIKNPIAFAEFNVDYYRGQMNDAIQRQDNAKLNESTADFVDAVKIYQNIWEANERAEFYKELNPPAPHHVPPTTQSFTQGNFTRSDAVNGLQYIYAQYGKDMAMKVERAYRLETTNFTSGQFRATGTAGMEAHGSAPYYGWSKGYFSDLPTGTWSAFENRGLSGIGGNAQVTDRKKVFVTMPSVTSAMIFMANFIQGHDGNLGRWFSTEPSKQAIYNSSTNGKTAPIVNSISNGN